VKATILVVDDQADEREALEHLLRHHDYVVESAANGREAIDRARHGARPDLVVLDLNMPVMDGWAFLQEAGEDHALRDMPVVVTSAAPEIQDTTVQLPTISFVAKPLRPQVMLQVIADMLHPPEASTPRWGEDDAVAVDMGEIDTEPLPAPGAHAKRG
jgi:CheY-like chemotaxis protein